MSGESTCGFQGKDSTTTRASWFLVLILVNSIGEINVIFPNLIWCFDYCSAESCLTYTKLLLYELYFFNCVLLQIYNQPIKWQQFMHNMIKKTCWSSNQATEWETKAHWTGHFCLFHSQPKTKKVRQQFTLAHQNWTAEDWKYVSCSDEPLFLLQHWDGRVQIGCKQHGYILPCISGPASRGVMVGGYFLGILCVFLTEHLWEKCCCPPISIVGWHE